ncbi:hypothetical protein [Microvirga flavescens]|uniref:hypothetical protein n=1 Tax=Microvirga flavescens TaxID=2249811 RepID=UPI001300A734|nr:hypothetical protein [Microvirga flavescens]
MSSTMICNASTTRTTGSFTPRVPALLVRFSAFLAKEIRIRRDMRLLASFDDAALCDIGLARGGLEDALRNGRCR